MGCLIGRRRLDVATEDAVGVASDEMDGGEVAAGKGREKSPSGISHYRARQRPYPDAG